MSKVTIEKLYVYKDEDGNIRMDIYENGDVGNCNILLEDDMTPGTYALVDVEVVRELLEGLEGINESWWPESLSRAVAKLPEPTND